MQPKKKTNSTFNWKIFYKATIFTQALHTLIATQEYLDERLVYRNAAKEKDEFNF